MNGIDQLIHRYLNDAGFRNDFDRDPSGSCARAGISVNADELNAARGLGTMSELPARISMGPYSPVWRCF